MRIESTHNVAQREQDERELASLSRVALLDELLSNAIDIALLPAWAFGSNHCDQLHRRQQAIRDEIGARRAA